MGNRAWPPLGRASRPHRGAPSPGRMSSCSRPSIRAPAAALPGRPSSSPRTVTGAAGLTGTSSPRAPGPAAPGPAAPCTRSTKPGARSDDGRSTRVCHSPSNSSGSSRRPVSRAGKGASTRRPSLRDSSASCPPWSAVRGARGALASWSAFGVTA
ncbi:MAG: hypothetical protein DRQ55_10885 [Planctomycetota bacterium]|nr:MAG: hypothetical protein DRQ55_10885 [Planctomycetota bacterium]